ncbi:hypothetical protein [Paraburkholderia caffeinilytica]|uniref:hypothetical protein n=1 Tax=Paraburkholderia caffeinilytica TaxID=1761016 RepID=UPI0038B7E3BC
MTIDFSKVNSFAGTSATSGSTSIGASSSNKPSFQSLLAELTDYVNGTPGERIEKMILAKLGVTEEELKKMSPEEREKIMAKVRDMLKKEMDAQLDAQKQKASGLQISVSV